MPSDKAVSSAVARLRNQGLFPTPFRVATLLGCSASDIQGLPDLTIEEIVNAAQKLKIPSIDKVSKILGAPYQLVRKLWIQAGLPMRRKGRPEIVDEEENKIILNWKGTDTALAKHLGNIKGRSYTKEAIRQKRMKLGKILERQEWKNKALQELRDGIRPAIVARRYGYRLDTVEEWYYDLNSRGEAP